MARQKRRTGQFDTELEELPPELRWREWMARVEAVIFSAEDKPVPRENLSRLIGRDCRLDDLLADIRAELKPRPYELVFVAGGWRIQTRKRVADAIKFAEAVAATEGPQLTPREQTILAIIAYHQPITRTEISRFCGTEVSRELIAGLREQNFVGAGPRAPEPGSPYTYVTTDTFLSVFGLGSLLDLPDREALEDAGLLAPSTLDEVTQLELDRTFGIAPEADSSASDGGDEPGIDG